MQKTLTVLRWLLVALAFSANAQTVPYQPDRTWYLGTQTGPLPSAVASSYYTGYEWASAEISCSQNWGSYCLWELAAQAQGGVQSNGQAPWLWNLTTDTRAPLSYSGNSGPGYGFPYKACSPSVITSLGPEGTVTTQTFDCTAPENYVFQGHTFPDCVAMTGEVEKAYWKTTIASGNVSTGLVPTGTPPQNSCSLGCVVAFTSLTGQVWGRVGEGYSPGTDIWVEMEVQVTPQVCKVGDQQDQYIDVEIPPATACLPQECGGGGGGGGGGTGGGDISQGSSDANKSNLDAKYASMVNTMNQRESLFSSFIPGLFNEYKVCPTCEGSVGGTGAGQWFIDWFDWFGIGRVEPVCKIESDPVTIAGVQRAFSIDFCAHASWIQTFLGWFFTVIVTVYSWVTVFGRSN